MLRRPIESKNTGPYRKLFIEILGDLIISGDEFDKQQVSDLIAGLESKRSGLTEEEYANMLLKIAINEKNYQDLIDFLEKCVEIMDTALPSPIYQKRIDSDKVDYKSLVDELEPTLNPDEFVYHKKLFLDDSIDKVMISKPIERRLRYEAFNYQLVVKSEKYEVVFPKSQMDEQPEYRTLIIRDKAKDESNNLVTIDEPYVTCAYCESIEDIMMKNSFVDYESKYYERKYSTDGNIGILNNGYDFSQGGIAHNFYYNSLLDPFLHQLRVDEIKHTYWCSYCGSLVFTRLFSKLNSSSVEIGVTVIAGEEIPKTITIDFPQNFVLYISRVIENLGNFLVYNNGISPYRLVRETSTIISIVLGTEKIGTLNFNIANKQLIIDLNTTLLLEKNMIDSNKNTTLFIEINKDAFLTDQLDSIDEYETIKCRTVFSNGDFKDYVGCIMRNDILSPAIKWSPKRVTFGELSNYPFERLGIDLMLFHNF